ncbi:MAG TPA: TerB family tellurite resistance protein [Rubricoccaceae bacterium]|nr:TerB family tellurite resistance protein [Rubricoccaceae bacterium]
MTSTAFDTLDLSTLPEEERLCFYGALFAMSDADRLMDEVETERIYESLDLDHLSPEARARVLAQAIQPPPLERCLHAFKDAPEEIRHGLMLNLLDVVLADESIEPGEHVGLLQASQILGLEAEEVATLHELAYAAQRTPSHSALRRPIRFVASENGTHAAG